MDFKYGKVFLLIINKKTLPINVNVIIIDNNSVYYCITKVIRHINEAILIVRFRILKDNSLILFK